MLPAGRLADDALLPGLVCLPWLGWQCHDDGGGPWLAGLTFMRAPRAPVSAWAAGARRDEITPPGGALR